MKGLETYGLEGVEPVEEAWLDDVGKIGGRECDRRPSVCGGARFALALPVFICATWALSKIAEGQLLCTCLFSF